MRLLQPMDFQSRVRAELRKPASARSEKGGRRRLAKENAGAPSCPRADRDAMRETGNIETGAGADLRKRAVIFLMKEGVFRSAIEPAFGAERCRAAITVEINSAGQSRPSRMKGAAFFPGSCVNSIRAGR